MYVLESKHFAHQFIGIDSCHNGRWPFIPNQEIPNLDLILPDVAIDVELLLGQEIQHNRADLIKVWK